MKQPLSKSLFQLGKPLSSGRWNSFVDATDAMARAWHHEHPDGFFHRAPRIEKAACYLVVDGGDWKVKNQYNIELISSTDTGTVSVLEFKLEPMFLSKNDYSVVAVTGVGAPALLIQRTKAPDYFVLNAPSPSFYAHPDYLAVIVYGRRNR